MLKELICISCPMGCHLKVDVENKTVEGNTYAKNGVHVYRREDRFINTTVTTRTIETNNSSGGSSGGGGGNSGSAGGHF